MSYLASGTDEGNNTLSVSPVWASLCPLTRGSSSVQDSCVWDHTSLLQKGLTTAQIPSHELPTPTSIRAQETPPEIPRLHPKPGHCRCSFCLSLSRLAKTSPPPHHSFSTERFPLPPGTAAQLAAHSVCSCVFTFEGVPLALCVGICLLFCVSIVRVGVFKHKSSVCLCVAAGTLYDKWESDFLAQWLVTTQLVFSTPLAKLTSPQGTAKQTFSLDNPPAFTDSPFTPAQYPHTSPTETWSRNTHWSKG